MLKVGLTGGYATGKSFISKRLEELGCFLIYADTLGHQVLSPDGDAYRSTLTVFGPQILNPDGVIDRKKLAAIVFQSPDLLHKLNAIVHPAVFRLEEQALIGFESQHPHGIAVVEAAILIETGRYKDFHRLIVATCSEETQLRRAVERDQVTRDQAQQRIARQLSNSERVRLADYVIDTGGTPEETIEQTDRVYAELRQLAEAPLP